MKFTKFFYLTFFIFLTNFVFAAEQLKIENAWIRAAPPGATMMAGYFKLKNQGEKTIVVTGTRSPAFADVSLHETVQKEGRARMEELGNVEITPGEKVIFAPGGKHLMLMNPVKTLTIGDVAEITFTLSSGSTVSANFIVRESAD